MQTKILQQDPYSHARILKISTYHGDIITPAFMPVGTRAAVNCMRADELKEAGSQIILGGNTYHMLIAPGTEVIQEMGGMHPFMGWGGSMLTDSGGFQLFSLSKNRKICSIDEEGGHFKHPNTGKIIHLTPKSSIETQKIIGADIIMAFDQCTPSTDSYELTLAAMKRTHRWLEASKEHHLKSPYSLYGYPQALFGIIQGGLFKELREISAQFISKMELDGLAIGGETIGFDMKKTVEIIDWIEEVLPKAKPRYTMGVGLGPQDLIDVINKGIDLFDCVAPTRNARHGALYHGSFVEENNWIKFEGGEEKGRILIKKKIYCNDSRPILSDCDCHTCQHHSRAYLHHLFKQNQPLYLTLASIHNVRLMHLACEKAQKIIKKNRGKKDRPYQR